MVGNNAGATEISSHKLWEVLWEDWFFDNFRGTKKKHQPRAVDARPVLPPCTSRGSNPGHPAPQMHFYEAPQYFISCYRMLKTRIKQGFKGIRHTM